MKTFQCKDVGYSDCAWKTQGDDENKMMQDIEQHGRQHHGIMEFKDDLKQKVKSAFRDVKAA